MTVNGGLIAMHILYMILKLYKMKSLKESLLTGYSKIKLSVSPPWKLARQYWTGLASSQEDYEKASKGGLRKLISDSTEWLEVVEEDIPKNALGFSVVLNAGTASVEDKYNAEFMMELI